MPFTRLAWPAQANPRLLVELQRLLHQHIISSVIPGVLLVLLLVWTLADAHNPWPLRLWGAATIGWKLFSAWVGRQQLRRGVPLERAHRNTWWLIALNAVDGALWGALAWVTLSSSTLAGSILVVAVIGGIAGSSMSSLSPVFPAFVAFVVCLLTGLATKLWTLGDPAYDALGVAGVLYTASLLGQSRNSAQAARQAITLRFENIELIERLRQETANAQAQRRAAEQANVAKSRFLAAASHDLRQPIHAQGMFLEVLGSGTAPLDRPQAEALDNARATWQASAEMLDTLLDFSRIEAGVIEPQRRLFALQPLLHKIESELAPQADAKGLVYRTRETPAEVCADPALVALVLRNLVSNAIRYTEQGGVLLGCRHQGGQWVVEVWDTGIGIPASQHQAIFQEFHQLGNAERDRRKGLGLGLAIAQGLARAMGHTLSLASRPGRGSVFRLSLPQADAAQTTPPWDDNLPTGPAHQTVLAGRRVLVIDDDEAVRDGMRQTLASWGCQCDVAESIEQALDLAHAQAPDLVISDYRLRDQRTGAEAIDLLRTALGRALPSLLVTGDTAPERLREAIDSSVTLLHKPVSPALLHQRMAEALRGVPASQPPRQQPTQPLSQG
ncbi:MAG: hybrid sensor histidine kinase/response regulator [Aquabacterium sp.]|jgi:two-component system, sensor histidine kinase|uniref:ATP-binding response regulator n=1 Tax=Aquabacterium sp. TaxID=1872578 RepID=UPI003BAEBD3A